MADGQLFKPEKDYTKDVDKQIPEAEDLAKVWTVWTVFELRKLTYFQSNVQAALEKLSALEKHTRQVMFPLLKTNGTIFSDRCRKLAIGFRFGINLTAACCNHNHRKELRRLESA